MRSAHLIKSPLAICLTLALASILLAGGASAQVIERRIQTADGQPPPGLLDHMIRHAG